ncbi:MAG: formate--tetrahydrofolate ligase [Spirochaetes bacterium GWF1_31_7]|nr:MAG: formate--tetrahydrofolate ligase [Spirochaetes bacterium GWE1_32_154]OHD46608.1 MAG: formate--tetrahydrofolate ligase [Spirochaetes bacterium GWE2_31_10]OHD47622.1 MAG: formate--tetrahydrofolate ligase [Spirochaetes bacterium GWF1_31_7]OHD72738.1 MAG: formate--tetrahydrofolate ligase [Spirochaetes bacterium RIFOXYB1_FULL_32_8]
MLSDIEISQKNKMVHINEIAEKVGISSNDLELYGDYKAKIKLTKINEAFSSKKKGKLILVTAITPTPAGEGKSTVSVGLGDALNHIGKKVIIALREPSLGPCFGVKGGATGGGYSQIVPMEDINLHFTGDIHAVSNANNLLSSIIDNHIYQGNELGIDPRLISWKRCVDLNDRTLRKIVVGLGGATEGTPREDGFNISVASEIMAVLCLSKSISELKERIGNIVIGETFNRRFVKVKELKVQGAIAALLKDAIKPNLVQTLEKTPAIVHGGPFANIAHGCNSLMATKTALSLADYVVTEAGFGADLGAEKFMDIKCRIGDIEPSTVVVVATVRALKMHGGVNKTMLSSPDTEAVRRGSANLKTHLENLKNFGVPIVVAINNFVTDTEDEVNAIKEAASGCGVRAVITKGWADGGKGVVELAHEVVKLCDTPAKFRQLYPDSMGLKEKVETIASVIYRADGVSWQPNALKKLKLYTEEGFGNFPVCIAKTQNSISHDKSLLGAPSGFTIPVRDVWLSAGAGFIVVLTGDIMTMPGLPKVPSAELIDVDENGVISGLF